MTSGQVSPTSPTILDAAGHIGVDLNCFNCGYNLRTLPVTGNCPECGCPVSQSTRDTRLCRADPEWVSTLAEYLLYLIVSTVAPVVWLCTIIALGLLFQPNFDETCVFIPVLLSALVATIALLTFTTPEPRQARYPRSPWARRVTRILLGLLVVLVLAALIKVSWTVSVVAWILASCIAFLVLPLVFFRYLADLMRRLPRDDLVRLSRICAWGLVGSVLSFVVCGLSENALARSSEPLLLLFWTLAYVGLVFFGVLALVTLVCAQRALAQAALQAAQDAHEGPEA